MVDTQYNKDKAYILGAGGFGRELESWITQTKQFTESYELVGFLDDNSNALGDFQNDLSVVGDLSQKSILEAKNVVLAISNSKVKEEIFLFVSEQKDVNFLSFRHTFSVVGKNSVIGSGLILCPFSIISSNVIVGNAVTINSGSQIGHDVSIGDYTSIMANVDIGGGAIIGKNVFIGSNAVILPRVKIPDNCRIGAGSVVLKNIKESGSYFGNPAKKIM